MGLKRATRDCVREVLLSISRNAFFYEECILQIIRCFSNKSVFFD